MAGRVPYRQIPPPTTGGGGKLTLESLKDEIERLKRRRRCEAVVIIILCFAGLIGYTVWLALVTNNTNVQQTEINLLQNNVTIIENNLLQLILESHSNVTVLQRGNVSWTLAQVISTDGSGAPVNSCMYPPDYINQGSGGVGSLIDGTYELQNVQIGSLNFTMLVLSPPAEALTYTIQSVTDGLILVCVTRFTPNVNILDTFNADAPNTARVFEFTASNLARIVSTPDCLLAETCYIEPYFYEEFSGNGAYSIQGSQQNPPQLSGEYFLQWIYRYTNAGIAPLGTNYTISEPLQLVIPSS